MPLFKVEKEIAGKLYTIESGKLANQANGAVTVKCEDTVVFASACMTPEPKEGMNFFPLTVDFEERKYAVGKIAGGFNKRDGKPSERAILISRLIDRPMRPLFPAGMRNDVQIVVMPLAAEEANPLDVLSVTAASAACAISDIPWGGPLGCACVCRVNGEFIANPSRSQLEESDMELFIAGRGGKLLEIELEAKEVSEEDLEKALLLAHEVCDSFVELQNELIALCGKPKADIPILEPDPELCEEIGQKVNDTIANAIRNPEAAGKESAIFDLRDQLQKQLAEEYEERAEEIPDILEKLIKKQVRHMVIDEGKRADGRRLDEIRPLSCEVGVLPRVHGNGLFSRGQTQVMTTLTIGSLDDTQLIDNLEEDYEKHFLHYYNFPPYSVGEVRPMRGAGRREIGHGALAEKALRPVLPSKEDFPYTMILVSDTFESNGSTSMASTCGSTLALMDGGIKIKAPVAGISIGLMSDDEHEVILTDIQGLEDFTGDMDFKVAGTREGITAIQVDTKTHGLSRNAVSQALIAAKKARLQILDLIESVIPEPRAEMSPYAPRVYSLTIDPEKIGELIGPGGKVIKKIQADTGAKISVEDDGTVYVASNDAVAADQAISTIKAITLVPEPGMLFEGPVVRIEAFGAFVEIAPGKDGLCHISELTPERLAKTEDYCKLVDVLKVRVKEIIDDGKIRLTHKEFCDRSKIKASAPSGGRSDNPRKRHKNEDDFKITFRNKK
ncbi:MAG: polyribonucleotide nucleotidyltransferase [Abditibacteriota bacterium]|nr:polyribonucleotide nucleotidyltransferase [Abditibacteriota bacterium]